MITTRTIAFTVITDDQGNRIRCCFCGAVLLTAQDAVTVRHLAELSEQLLTHECYAGDARHPPGFRRLLRH